MPSKRLIPLTEHGGEEPVLQYSPMCSVWALTTYDACDIRCSYCASYAQGPSKPRASAEEVRTILERELATIGRDQTIGLGIMIDCYTHAEAEHQVTRATLEVLVADDRNLVIVTKGTLIERDLDLRRGYGKLAVNVSLPSLRRTSQNGVLRLAEEFKLARTYTERLDLRASFRVRPELELSAGARNLLQARHAEWSDGLLTSATEVPRDVYASLAWRF